MTSFTTLHARTLLPCDVKIRWCFIDINYFFVFITLLFIYVPCSDKLHISSNFLPPEPL